MRRFRPPPRVRRGCVLRMLDTRGRRPRRRVTPGSIEGRRHRRSRTRPRGPRASAAGRARSRRTPRVHRAAGGTRRPSPRGSWPREPERRDPSDGVRPWRRRSPPRSARGRLAPSRHRASSRTPPVSERSRRRRRPWRGAEVARTRKRGDIPFPGETHAPFYVCDGRKGAARFRGVRRREPRGGDSGRAGRGCGVGARVSRTARGIRACVDARGRSERPQPRPIGVPERWVSSENVAGVVTHVVNPKRGKRTFLHFLRMKDQFSGAMCVFSGPSI